MLEVHGLAVSGGPLLHHACDFDGLQV
jgi:hypothetical protein